MKNYRRQAELYLVSNIVLQKLRPELLVKPEEIVCALGLDKTDPADVEYAIELIDAIRAFILEKWDLKDDDC